MTSNGHRNAQHHQGDPHAQQYMGSDRQAHSYGMGGAGTRQPQPEPGKQYGYSGQGVYSLQGYPGQQGYQAGQAYGQYGQANTAGQFGRPGVGFPQGYVAPITSQPVQVKRKRGKGFWIALVIGVICLAAAGVLAFVLLQGGPSARSGTKGQLEGKTEAEIQAELDRIVEEGMFNISIASVVQFADGTSEGELRIENVPGNRYLMKVDITRDDTGETVYTSDMIEPDYHIQRDTLDVDLPAGTYPCTAVFTAYDPETESEVGKAAAQITLQVQS